VRGNDGPVRATVDVTVEPLTETSSRLTIAVDFDWHGIGRLLAPLIVCPHAENCRWRSDRPVPAGYQLGWGAGRRPAPVTWPGRLASEAGGQAGCGDSCTPRGGVRRAGARR
jgi:hypothetical protein